MIPAQMKACLEAGIPQAFAEGKTIQKSINGYEWGWVDLKDLTLTDDPSRYRVKPEPPTPKARQFNAEEMESLVRKTIRTEHGSYLITRFERRGTIKFGDNWHSSGELRQGRFTIDGKRCEVIE